MKAENEPTTEPSAPAIKLPATLSRHDAESAKALWQPATDARPGYYFRDFRIGSGNMSIAEIYGRDLPPGTDATPLGWPRPTIAEAEAIADEIIRRWNARAAAEALVDRWIERERALRGAGSLGMATTLSTCRREMQEALGLVWVPTPADTATPSGGK